MTNKSRRLIFVFGSNMRGIHSSDVGKKAVMRHAAKNGVAEGLQGNAYAIPVRDKDMWLLSLEEIEANVDTFIRFARENQDLQFDVNKQGFVLGRFGTEAVAEMFRDVPDNCYLPPDWMTFLGKT